MKKLYVLCSGIKTKEIFLADWAKLDGDTLVYQNLVGEIETCITEDLELKENPSRRELLLQAFNQVYILRSEDVEDKHQLFANYLGVTREDAKNLLYKLIFTGTSSASTKDMYSAALRGEEI